MFKSQSDLEAFTLYWKAAGWENALCLNMETRHIHAHASLPIQRLHDNADSSLHNLLSVWESAVGVGPFAMVRVVQGLFISWEVLKHRCIGEADFLLTRVAGFD